MLKELITSLNADLKHPVREGQPIYAIGFRTKTRADAVRLMSAVLEELSIAPSGFNSDSWQWIMEQADEHEGAFFNYSQQDSLKLGAAIGDSKLPVPQPVKIL